MPDMFDSFFKTQAQIMNFIKTCMDNKLTDDALINNELAKIEERPDEGDIKGIMDKLFLHATKQDSQIIHNKYAIKAILYLVSKFPETFFTDSFMGKSPSYLDYINYNIFYQATRHKSEGLVRALGNLFIEHINFEDVNYQHIVDTLCNVMDLMQQETVQDNPQALNELKNIFRRLYNKFIEQREEHYFCRKCGDDPQIDTHFVYNGFTAYAVLRKNTGALMVLLENKSNDFIKNFRDDTRVYEFSIQNPKFVEAMTKKGVDIEQITKGSIGHPHPRVFAKFMEAYNNNPSHILDQDQLKVPLYQYTSSNEIRETLYNRKSANNKINVLTKTLLMQTKSQPHVLIDFIVLIKEAHYTNYSPFETLITALNDNLMDIITKDHEETDANDAISELGKLYQSMDGLYPDSQKLIEVQFKVLKKLISWIEKSPSEEATQETYIIIIKGLKNQAESIHSLSTSDNSAKTNFYTKLISYANRILQLINNDKNISYSFNDYQRLNSLYEKLLNIEGLDLSTLPEVAITAKLAIETQQQIISSVKESLVFNLDEVEVSDSIESTFLHIVNKKLSTISTLLSDRGCENLEYQQKVAIIACVKESLTSFIAQSSQQILSNVALDNLNQTLKTTLNTSFNNLKSNFKTYGIFIDSDVTNIFIDQARSELNQAMWNSTIVLTKETSKQELEENITNYIARLTIYIEEIINCNNYQNHAAYPLFLEKLCSATNKLNNHLNSDNSSINSNNNPSDLLLETLKNQQLTSTEKYSVEIINIQINLINIAITCIKTLDDNTLKLNQFINLLDAVKSIKEIITEQDLPSYNEKIKSILIELANAVENDSETTLNYPQSLILIGIFKELDISGNSQAFQNLQVQCEKNIEQMKQVTNKQREIVDQLNEVKYTTSLQKLAGSYQKICENVMKDELLNNDSYFLGMVYKLVMDQINRTINDEVETSSEFHQSELAVFETQLRSIGTTLNFAENDVQKSISIIIENANNREQYLEAQQTQHQQTGIFLSNFNDGWKQVTTLTKTDKPTTIKAPKIPAVNIEDMTKEDDEIYTEMFNL